jgi:hypothetical protein
MNVAISSKPVKTKRFLIDDMGNGHEVDYAFDLADVRSMWKDIPRASAPDQERTVVNMIYDQAIIVADFEQLHELWKKNRGKPYILMNTRYN